MLRPTNIGPMLVGDLIDELSQRDWPFPALPQALIVTQRYSQYQY